MSRAKDQIFVIKVPGDEVSPRSTDVSIWRRHSTVRALNANNLLKSAMVAAIVNSDTGKIISAATIKGVELAGEFNDELAIIGKVLPGTLNGRILNVKDTGRQTLYLDDPWNLIKTEPTVVQYYMS